MSVLWKDVRNWLADATKSAIKETEDLARRGRIKMEILGINTALNDKFLALGGVVYELLKKGERTSIKNDEKVKKLVAEIAKLETQLGAMKKERPEKKTKSTTTKKTSSAKPSTKKAPPRKAKKTPTKTASKKAATGKTPGKKPTKQTAKTTGRQVAPKKSAPRTSAKKSPPAKKRATKSKGKPKE